MKLCTMWCEQNGDLSKKNTQLPIAMAWMEKLNNVLKIKEGEIDKSNVW